MDLKHFFQHVGWFVGLNRLEKNGELDNMLVTEAAPARRVVFYLFGFLAIAAGIYLVAGALVNVRLITW